jgi:hypothetical protein
VAAKNAEQLLHEFRNNAAVDVTMSLLHSKDALLYLALMAAHLGDGQIVDGQTLTAAMDTDLPGHAARLHGRQTARIWATSSSTSTSPWRRALDAYTELGVPEAGEVRERLGSGWSFSMRPPTPSPNGPLQ